MPAPFPPSTSVESLLRLVGSAEGLASIAADLEVTAGVLSGGSSGDESGADANASAWLAPEGFSVLASLAERARCAALIAAVDALAERHLPAVFVYAFDEPWVIGERIRRRISALSGHDYRLVEDIWAWRIPPGSGGWPPHRGIADVLLDREAPEILNVWVALSDVTADRACMHAVPLDDDPGYPEALARVDAPLESVRALPVAAGDALVWNANVLHWGGRCAPRAAGARVSCSFTLCRADAADRFPGLALLGPLEILDLMARLDVVARMVLLYGDAERGDVSATVRQWANLTHELAARFGGGSEGPAGLRKAP